MNDLRSFYAAITFTVALFPTLAGCNKVKKEVARQLMANAPTTKVNRGFHIVNGEALFLDSNASEGRITRKLPEANVATFRALKQPSNARALFAVDKEHVFMGELYNVVIIANADPSTFEVLTDDGVFAHDLRSVYFMGVALEGSDPATFQLLEYPFGKDANHAYVGTIPIPVEDLPTWVPLKRGHPEDPWYRGMRDKHPRPHKELLAFGWSKDKNRVYYGENPVAADAATFVALDRFYAKDISVVYYGSKIVEGADANTFVVHDGPYIGDSDIRSGPGPDAHDARQRYEYGRVYNR